MANQSLPLCFDSISGLGANLDELGVLNQEMVTHVSSMPGFLAVKDYSAQDWEMVVIAEFDSIESVDAWKAHPDHLRAQQQGREKYFSDYRIQVCDVIRTLEFTEDSGTQQTNLDWTPDSPVCISRTALQISEGTQAAAQNRPKFATFNNRK